MLQQGMVVARQTTDTYIVVVFQRCHIFLFDTVRVQVFHLSKTRIENRFPVPIRAVNRIPVHKTDYSRSMLMESRVMSSDSFATAGIVSVNS